MKQIVIAILLVTAFTNLYAQDSYLVSFKFGNVVTASGKKVVVGSKLDRGEKIIFSKAADRVTLVHPKQGRITLTGMQAGPRLQSVPLSMLADYLKVTAERRQLSAKKVEPRVHTAYGHRADSIETARFRFLRDSLTKVHKRSSHDTISSEALPE